MRLRRTMMAITACAGLVACGDGDPLGHPDIQEAAIYLDGTLVTERLVLTKGADMRLEVRFLDDDGEPIRGLRPGHTASLTFDPAFLATVTDVSDDGGFFFDLTVVTSAGASGELHIGFGHAGATDELAFGPIEVVIGG